MGVWARAFRRAALPVRMSQGFNPRPRFSLPAPLPVGIEGLDEVIELDLTERTPPEDLCRRLDAVLPEGVKTLRAETVEPAARAPIGTLAYRLLGPLPDGAVERCAAGGLRATRPGGKEVDVSRYLTRLSPCDGGCDFELAVTDEGTARPAEVVAALCGAEPERSRHMSVVRTSVNLVAR